jgi:hypothetical protein
MILDPEFSEHVVGSLVWDKVTGELLGIVVRLQGPLVVVQRNAESYEQTLNPAVLLLQDPGVYYRAKASGVIEVVTWIAAILGVLGVLFGVTSIVAWLVR